MASSSSAPPHELSEDAAVAGAVAAVCCMCGDHGLPRELFRCKACRVRLQHSYCSDLYPRATAYRRCNWCLREPPPPPAQGGGAAGYSAAYGTSNKPAAAETKRNKPATAADEERPPQHRHEAGWSSSMKKPPAELGYYYPAVKKKRKAHDERAPAADAGVKGSCSSNAGGETKELMRAGSAARARVKVRRYKLLAEVISC